MTNINARKSLEQPLVSVIIPTYNRRDFISEALTSVFQQTYSNFEIILIDDGSQDDTATVIEPLLSDRRMQYYRQTNQGQAVARNNGLARAKGEFICFLDSDNRWLKDKLRITVEIFAKHTDTDIVYGDVIMINADGNVIDRSNMKRHSGRIARFMFRDNCVSMNTAMARRRCFDEMGGMDTTVAVADDYELWLRFSARYHFLYVPEFFAEYRVMPDQISSDKTRRFASNQQIMRRFQDRFPEAMTAAEFAEGWCHFHTRQGRYHAQRGNIAKAFRQYCIALGHRPFAPAPWRGLARLCWMSRGEDT